MEMSVHVRELANVATVTRRTTSPFSFFCKKKSDDEVDERSILFAGCMRVCRRSVLLHKSERETLMAGGTNTQERVFAFGFLSKTYATNSMSDRSTSRESDRKD